jgi:hypothetical protein
MHSAPATGKTSVRRSRKRAVLLFEVGLFFANLALKLPSIGVPSMWDDEAVTLHLAQQPIDI